MRFWIKADLCVWLSNGRKRAGGGEAVLLTSEIAKLCAELGRTGEMRGILKKPPRTLPKCLDEICIHG